MRISKSTLTDLSSIALIATSTITPEPYATPLLVTGLFALSGAVTNQLAIHMLFNRVPLLYGSGVIEKNFESFKGSIKSMIMKQFFTGEQLKAFFQNEEQKINLAPLVESADFSPAFVALKQSVMESKLGDALNFFGGEKALDSLQEPFAKRLKLAVVGIVSSDTFKAQMNHHLEHSSLNDDLRASVEDLIDKRLADLTPKMVNNLVHELIHTHLGWLVVWGGVFGGAIGLLSSFIISC
ncbi:DUF445 domain-containing protein [Sulfurovum sp. bin170]|uniref:DUF445 domain-containing protein n=1 Tax=Sulfurovum sp. bin170 TaxID=2695268 RepID=UPI0013DF2085|nr:DUF445 domain-containing protein [Sulfurovum sp. bin170]NEW61202.1 DUF445 domain-containing protein [Sulfurovum sp. bin170]